MKFTTIYGGKDVVVSIPAELTSIGSVNGVYVDITIPSGFQYKSSVLPQGDYDIEARRWNIGTMTGGDSLSGDFTFTVVDIDDVNLEEVEFSWEIGYPAGVETNLQNNTSSEIILPAFCDEIKDCIGCDFGKVIYQCKTFDYTLQINNYTEDIQENIHVFFSAPSEVTMLFKSGTATYGTVSLGESSGGGLSSTGITGIPCSGTYYQNVAWHIPTLPALTVAEITLKVWVVTETQLDQCDKITYEIEHEDQGIFDGQQGELSIKGLSGQDFIASIGYKEWLGRIYYNPLPVTVDGVSYASAYKAVAYNRNTVNYLGDLTLTNVDPGEFTLTSTYPIFSSLLIATQGQKSLTSGALETFTYVDANTVEFTIDSTTSNEIDITLSIKSFV